MEEDESTNQNPVKKAEFLWISGAFHFGNSTAMVKPWNPAAHAISRCQVPSEHSAEK
jgi:hypothetical protein